MLLYFEILVGAVSINSQLHIKGQSVKLASSQLSLKVVLPHFGSQIIQKWEGFPDVYTYRPLRVIESYCLSGNLLSKYFRTV